MKDTPPFGEVRNAVRLGDEQDSAQLVAIFHVVAEHSQTIAAANDDRP